MSYYTKSTITRTSYAQLLYVCDTMTITFTGVNSVRIWQSGVLLKTLWITPKSGPQTTTTKKI
jgi:hypothetical protein